MIISKKNYLQTYFWKIIAMASGFLSLLIVIPRLSDQPEIFGIYSLCISFTLYFTYADIGFLNSGQKYAAEEFAVGNRAGEIEIFGFTGIILLLMFFPFSVALGYLAFQPELIISQIDEEHKNIAKHLFLTIAIATPLITLIQRLTQSILAIRIKDFVSSRIELVGSLVRIFSVFYFFGDGKYEIVPYYYFITGVSLASGLVVLAVVKYTENYDLRYFLKSLKISRKYYDKMKKLAFSSLAATLAWVLFYELDLVIIGKLLTPMDLAIYSAAFIAFNFLRSLYNIIYSPFYPRFNHMVGAGDEASLKAMARDLISFTLPLCVSVTAVLYLGSEYLIYFWVGQEYANSVPVFRFLLLGTAVTFILQPGAYFMYAKEKYYYINLAAVTSLVVFIGVIILTFQDLHLISVALAKTTTFLVLALINFWVMREVLNLKRLIIDWGFRLIVSLTIAGILLPIILEATFPLLSKSVFDLFILCIIMGGSITLLWGALLLSHGSKRGILFENISKLIKRYR